MLQAMNRYYVNWIDGMKISRSQFLQLQEATEARITDVRSLLIGSGYGILPGKYKATDALDYQLTVEHPDKVEFSLRQCRAVTPNGERIEILADISAEIPGLKTRFDLSPFMEMDDPSGLDIVLIQESASSVAFGAPDPREVPPRHPDLIDKIRLELLPAKDFNYGDINPSAVVLARLVHDGREWVQDRDYIPPCYTMDAVSEVDEFFHRYMQFIKDMESNLFQIIQKGNATPQKTSLAQSFDTLARRVLDVVENEVDRCDLIYRKGSPALFIAHTRRLARSIKNGIELLTNSGKDEAMNYVKEVIDVDPGKYLRVTTEVIDWDFDNHDLNVGLQRILEFCQLNGKLFDQLSRLDYIGKKKQLDFYLDKKTTQEEPKKQAKRKWDF